MKKLVLVFTLVALFSGFALAAPPYDWRPLPNHLDEPHNIDIFLTIEKFAHIGYVNNEFLGFTLSAPSSTGDTDPRENRIMEFAANTAVYVELEEDITSQIWQRAAEKFGEEEIKGLPLHVYLTLDDKNPIGGLDVGAFSKSDRTGAKNRFLFSPGRYTETIVLGYGWNAYLLDREAGAGSAQWDDFSWWVIESGDYTGSLTVTILAADE